MAPKILCGGCSLELYAPAAGGIFKCGRCGLKQRCPAKLDELIRSKNHIVCNAAGCMCQCFKKSGNKKTDTRGVAAAPGLSKCRTCNHKQSMHQMSSSDMKSNIPPPLHWVGDTSSASSKRKQVNKELKATVQKLMDWTWKDVTTRDRAPGEKVHKFEVVQVLQNQNPSIWKRYVNKRAVIYREMKMLGNPSVIKPRTNGFVQRARALSEDNFEPLYTKMNEMYLFHGTSPSAASSICETDFKTSFTGTNKGTLLGQGVYFAESSSKSDEYAKDDDSADGLYQGLYACLLCRVTMGHINVNEDKTPDADALTKTVQAGEFHSVLGDREKVRGTFREFVVFDADQVYPEFVVIYRRV